MEGREREIAWEGERERLRGREKGRQDGGKVILCRDFFFFFCIIPSIFFLCPLSISLSLLVPRRLAVPMDLFVFG